ncbi:hypothetical protein BO86DRAFT_153230 [Aspergillus japonicus CBS 114.51]|uniref:Uncharacterized protein n=2 Tax=Aspergillus TaxID=5052 RepID=A0A2V5IA36_ASPV1|nr:hypothetical protein BO86DRAFT_153230 [Aspergillus japonicus CBS 114.51]PYI16486.1 hypothetical protein BO99DRAFT_415013 [Aspergillus violaceofuscus CBS 115571]RAH79365.1 hypothetical protein BO86DRAFT_153230 [Aspergillus japonicus CBS 114.51]
MKLHPLWLLTLLVTLVTSTAIKAGCDCALATDNDSDNDQVSHEFILAYVKCMHGCTEHVSIKKALDGYISLYTRDNVVTEPASVPDTDVDASSPDAGIDTDIDDDIDIDIASIEAYTLDSNEDDDRNLLVDAEADTFDIADDTTDIWDEDDATDPSNTNTTTTLTTRTADPAAAADDLSTRDRKCHRRCRRTKDCCHTDICYSGVCLGPGKSP